MIKIKIFDQVFLARWFQLHYGKQSVPVIEFEAECSAKLLNLLNQKQIAYSAFGPEGSSQIWLTITMPAVDVFVCSK